MNRYSIELSEEQMQLIAQCLEDIHRFASGQCNLNYTVLEVLRELPRKEQMERREQAEGLLRQVKHILFPGMHDNSSKNYNGTEFGGNTYQIYRTILHQLAVDNNWDNVYSSPTLPSGTMCEIKIKKL